MSSSPNKVCVVRRMILSSTTPPRLQDRPMLSLVNEKVPILLIVKEFFNLRNNLSIEHEIKQNIHIWGHSRLGYYFWDKGLKDYVAMDLGIYHDLLLFNK